MVQKTKSVTTDTTEDATSVPTQVNDTSSQVSDDACCVLADIDSLLDEVVEPVLEEWEQEFDPEGSRPNRKKWSERYHHLWQNVGEGEAYDHWSEYRRREKQWHEHRGLTWNSCVC